MTLSRLALIPVALLLAGCVTSVQSPVPAAAAFMPPADGFLPVTPMPVEPTKDSAWGWRVRTPDGIWKVVCRYDVRAAGFPRDFTVQLAKQLAKQPGVFTTVATFADCPAPGRRGLKVNLHTVIGFPSARYLRIAASRLGSSPVDEPGVHRLQFSRVRLLRP